MGKKIWIARKKGAKTIITVHGAKKGKEKKRGGE